MSLEPDDRVAERPSLEPVSERGAPAGSVDELRDAVARSVAQRRRERGWSLRHLSSLTGVSKTVLSGIEKGTGNPALETLWRIVEVLDMPFSELVQNPDNVQQVIRSDEGRRMRAADGETAVRLLFSSAERRRLEMYELTMPPDATSEWGAHYGVGTREYVFVIEGTIRVETAGNAQVLNDGDAFVFSADHSHSYSSLTSSARILCILATSDR